MSSMFAEIPKLTSSADYPRWSQTILAYLGTQKAKKVVTKSRPQAAKDDEKDQAAVDAWMELEDIALGVIALTVHSKIGEAISQDKLAKEVWDELTVKYSTPGPSGMF